MGKPKNIAQLSFIVGGVVVTIDREDSDVLAGLESLSIMPDNNTNYVQARLLTPQGKKNKRLHRLIFEKHGIEAEVIDHINRDALDNRKANLRPATISQNRMNSRQNKNTSSRFRGVSFSKCGNNWRARCGRKHLGVFTTEEEAARAYDEKIVEYAGEFAILNFPGGVES